MSKKIVTEDLVVQAAQALTDESVEPTTKKVQERIGGGSFSTVQRYLEPWRHKQEQLSMIDLPSEIKDEATRFAVTAWELASRLASAEVLAIKKQAASDQAATRTELQDAYTEIARLEAVATEQAAELDTRESARQQTEIELSQLRVELGRLRTVEDALQDSRAALAEKSEEVARLKGESEALRAQLSALLARLPAIQPNKGKSGGRSPGA